MPHGTESALTRRAGRRGGQAPTPPAALVTRPPDQHHCTARGKACCGTHVRTAFPPPPHTHTATHSQPAGCGDTWNRGNWQSTSVGTAPHACVVSRTGAPARRRGRRLPAADQVPTTARRSPTAANQSRRCALTPCHVRGSRLFLSVRVARLAACRAAPCQRCNARALERAGPQVDRPWCRLALGPRPDASAQLPTRKPLLRFPTQQQRRPHPRLLCHAPNSLQTRVGTSEHAHRRTAGC